ncbi:MAG: acyltransferase family protein [Actinobacteria bacterium]|uniref:Unannotated protein n=1 Tax=freshwater metagenome TaxID=449393 RepID=A0A6J6NM46_9ZZZZ|nr:acyltransferase family protein [Actinomycetota bacterium]
MATEHRSDVQGLRAIAVLTVIAAHAGVPFLPGGFVGVDVFFVISGFLISGLLYGELRESGRFSLVEFWSRRARRILPAATFVTVVTLAVSLAWMSLVSARSLVTDAIWATLFAANVHFSQQGVYYFATDTGPSALQHYWSLAVEEQFYVVWPLLLIAVTAAARVITRRGRQARLPRRTIFVVLVLATGASLAWSIVHTQSEPATAYFSTSTRAWELGIGALTALVAPWVAPRLPRWIGVPLQVAGLTAIVVACLAYSASTPFPGVAALLPVLGAAALLLVGATPTGLVGPVRWLLSVRPMRTIGDWSYSLYLWHWPALILVEHRLERHLTGLEAGVVVLAVFALAALTYRFVEMPFRSGRPARALRVPRALVLYPLSVALVAGACLGSWSYTSWRGGEFGDNPPITASGASGDDTVALVRASVNAARDRMAVPSDLSPDLLELRDSVADVGECDYEHDVRELCARGNPEGTHTIVVTGDSHARAWIPAFDRITADSDWRVFYLVKPQCPAAHVTVAPVQEDIVFSACDDFHDWVVDQVDALSPDLVVVASSPPVNGVWTGGDRVEAIEEVAPLLESGYDELFDQLRASADRVVLIKDVPKSAIDPAECLTTGSPSLGDCMFRPVERSVILGDVAVKSALLAGAEVVDPTPWLCWKDECPVVIGGTLAYRDTDHITAEYSATLAGALGRALGITP